jgi:hypothetical protein
MNTDLTHERAVLRCVYKHPEASQLEQEIATREFLNKFPGEPIENLTRDDLTEEEIRLGQVEANIIVETSPGNLYEGLRWAMDEDEDF